MKKTKLIKLDLSSEILNNMNKLQKISAKDKRKIAREAKHTAEHFKKDGWDLDHGIVINDLLITLLGYNPEWHFMIALSAELNRPLYIHGNHNSVLSLHPSDKKKTAYISSRIEPKSDQKVKARKVIK